MIKPPTNSPARRPHARRSGCINFHTLSKCLPAILQFDYHLLLMATFNFGLTKCKSKTTKSDAKFNWKSFYFLVCLIGLCVDTTSGTLLPRASGSPSSSGDIFSGPIDSRQNRSKIDSKFDDEFDSQYASLPNTNRTEYLSRQISPTDQQPNQTSTTNSSATFSTYQIFNDQTSDDRLRTNSLTSTKQIATNQTNRTATDNHLNFNNSNLIDGQRKPCNGHSFLPLNRTIRPSLITTYSAERQNSRTLPVLSSLLSSHPDSHHASQTKNSTDPVRPNTRSSQTYTELSGANIRTEIESKMRRRFAADNSDQQKGLNEEDSKNYNQKKRDKMQKMQNYEQQVVRIINGDHLIFVLILNIHRPNRLLIILASLVRYAQEAT